MPTLFSLAQSRDNNFNLIRFVAAAMVLVSHSYPLALGEGTPEPISGLVGITIGTMAVDIFFVTSGFLIAGSLNNRNNLFAFIWARVLRIYPALIIALFFCVFVVGLAFTTHSVAAYFSDFQTYKFLARNSILYLGIEYSLPGVFLHLPYADAVNGSLWTLPYEVKMYAIFAAINVLLVKLQQKWHRLNLAFAFAFLAAASLCVYLADYLLALQWFETDFMHLFVMYFVGVAFYYNRQHIVLGKPAFAFAFAMLLISSLDEKLFFVAYNLLLAYLVFCTAYLPGGKIREFNKIGDYSYGIYIYAFPVQQSTAVILGEVSVLEMILVASFFTFILAFLSWHLVEKRCLKFKNRYRFAEEYIGKLRMSFR